MSVYKNEKTKKWEVSTYYRDFENKPRKKMKRGFLTKGEALEWEREFLTRKSKSLNMTFEQLRKLIQHFKNMRKWLELKESKYMDCVTHMFPC